MDRIDSMLLVMSFILIYVNSESDHNFDLFIDSDPTAEDLDNSDASLGCDHNECTKIQFSLPDMKFWEVWKEDNKNVDRSDTTLTTDSPHWPKPPAIWGEAIMGQQSNRPPKTPPHNPNKGPIITKLDKIVDILRPVGHHQNDRWHNFDSHKPESRYDSKDNYYDYDMKPKTDDYLNDKNIDKRNLKKYIIEEKEEKEVSPELLVKKRKKKPTFIIEEELIPVDRVEEPNKEVVYKIVKKPKPKPKTQHIIIEEEDNEETAEQEVIYHKTTPKKEKVKEIYILANDDVKEDYPEQKQIVITTRAPLITRSPTQPLIITTIKPVKKQKKNKTSVETQDNNELEEREGSEEVDEDYEYETEDEEEEAWGSASPESRTKPNRSQRQRYLNPFSALRGLRPRPRPHPKPYPYPPQRPHPPHSASHQGGMVPGGTFRMRFFMDGPKYRESTDDYPDY